MHTGGFYLLPADTCNVVPYLDNIQFEIPDISYKFIPVHDIAYTKY